MAGRCRPTVYDDGVGGHAARHPIRHGSGTDLLGEAQLPAEDESSHNAVRLQGTLSRHASKAAAGRFRPKHLASAAEARRLSASHSTEAGYAHWAASGYETGLLQSPLVSRMLVCGLLQSQVDASPEPQVQDGVTRKVTDGVGK